MSRYPIRSFLQARDPSVDRKYRPRPLRQVNLENLIVEDEKETDNSEHEIETSSTCSSNNSTQTEGASVYLRFRPLSNGKRSSAYLHSGNVLVTKNGLKQNKFVENHFTFTNIMEEDVSQSKVYESCIQRSIEAGENLTVLTYGTSGSGKTHTHVGTAGKPGLIPRALEHIFTAYESNIHEMPCINLVNAGINFLNDDDIAKHNQLRRQILIANDNERSNHSVIKNLILNEHSFVSNAESRDQSVFVWISFAEIYNDIVYDLLRPSYEHDVSKKKGLTIVSNKGRVFVKKLTSIWVRNSLEAHLLLKRGTQRITFGSTAVNNHSSRSHCVFFIDVITRSYPDIVSFHSYKLCDLAGSERQNKAKNIGSRLQEAQRINTSLLVLGRCLDAVYHNQQKKTADIVPYRESKLTTLLQVPLLGKEKMTMIVNINPVDEYFEENVHVLGFASIAKNIIFKREPKVKEKRTRYSWLAAIAPLNSSLVNKSEDYGMLQEENIQLKNKVEILRSEVTRLKRAFTIQEMDLKRMLIEEREEMMQKQDENWSKRLDQQKGSLRECYESKIQIMEVEHQRKLSQLSVYVTDSESELNEPDKR